MSLPSPEEIAAVPIGQIDDAGHYHFLCIGGPLHGRKMVLKQPRIEVPVRDDDDEFVRPLPPNDDPRGILVRGETIRYSSRVFGFPDGQSIRVLSPETMTYRDIFRHLLAIADRAGGR